MVRSYTWFPFPGTTLASLWIPISRTRHCYKDYPTGSSRFCTWVLVAVSSDTKHVKVLCFHGFACYSFSKKKCIALLHITARLYTSSSTRYIQGILPKGPYPPCLRMADRALLAGYPRYIKSHSSKANNANILLKWFLLYVTFIEHSPCGGEIFWEIFSGFEDKTWSTNQYWKPSMAKDSLTVTSSVNRCIPSWLDRVWNV